MGLGGVMKNEQQRAYLVVAVVFTPLSILAVILRFWASKRAGRKPHVEDWLALLSLIIYLAFGSVNLVGTYASKLCWLSLTRKLI